MSNEPIPFLDLVSLHKPLENELLEVCRNAIRTAHFIGGSELEGFEREFAEYCGVPHCAGVGNGTDAVRFALMACGVGKGDAVVTVSHTFIATVEGISQAGAEVEFVDIDERTYNMSPKALADYLESCETDGETGRPRAKRSGLSIKAIVPVHLYGQCADMDPILEIAEKYGLFVIEDAAQAQGSEYLIRRNPEFRIQNSESESRTSVPACPPAPNERVEQQESGTGNFPASAEGAPGTRNSESPHSEFGIRNSEFPAEGVWRRAGSFGRAAAFSFYPGKNLGACGEAGAVVSSDEEVIKKVRMIRDHGQAQKYYHDIEGYNGRLDAIQAGMLRIKLRHLDDWNAKRRAAAELYSELLPSAFCLLPSEPDNCRAIYHLYVIRHPDRDALMQHLKQQQIYTALHYPVPIHLQKAYAELGYREGDFPVTEKICQEIISLPMFPDLTDDQIQRVTEGIHEFTTTVSST